MGRLIGMLTRVAIWAAVGAGIGYIGVMGYEMAFKSGTLQAYSRNAGFGGSAGAVVGAVLGFFKKA